jgi:hypothetical protein
VDPRHNLAKLVVRVAGAAERRDLSESNRRGQSKQGQNHRIRQIRLEIESMELFSRGRGHSKLSVRRDNNLARQQLKPPLKRASKRRDRKRPSMRPWIKRLSALKRGGGLPLLLRGRRFTNRGLRTIMRCVAAHYGEGRTRISEVICVRLAWRQPNGWLKDRACRDVLRRLEELRLLRLPPRLAKPSNRKLPENDPGYKKLLSHCIGAPVLVMPETISLEFAKGNAAERLWNAVIEKHHYLGHRVQVGRCLKYLVRGDDKLLGAISFSSPAWRLAVRDRLMELTGIAGPSARDFVINNGRFCILPEVRVPHLASRILAYATRQVANDWSKFYSVEPLLAETFVEPNRFLGTCYRAANWNEIGMTNGYAKLGASHHNSQQPKKIFVYGLTRAYRRKLAAAIHSL